MLSPPPSAPPRCRRRLPSAPRPSRWRTTGGARSRASRARYSAAPSRAAAPSIAAGHSPHHATRAATRSPSSSTAGRTSSTTRCTTRRCGRTRRRRRASRRSTRPSPLPRPALPRRVSTSGSTPRRIWSTPRAPTRRARTPSPARWRTWQARFPGTCAGSSASLGMIQTAARQSALRLAGRSHPDRSRPPSCRVAARCELPAYAPRPHMC
mmetsp:Transcript_49827/g.123866  ORF Transcript_49827/g.123866 Transcript_49827/m.123866 type:complete len:210 (+) Transcript_49827:475-1104(+)